MVARAVARHSILIGDHVMALDRSGLDITDRSAIDLVLYSAKPEAVINCAAYTDVDGAESEGDRCYAANTLAVRDLAEACGRSGARFVTISSDYVFDGRKEGFYTESDEPNPLGVYGKSKLEGERLALSANPASVVVRSGWIYGHGGKNFLSVMHRLLSDGKAIKAIGDSYGTPTYADDLAARLRDLAGLEVSGVIHVTNGGKGTSYLGFAEAVCEAGGFERSLLDPVSSDQLKRPAPRPQNSRLASERGREVPSGPLPDWRDALSRFLSSDS